jgi:hypothetical protein
LNFIQVDGQEWVPGIRWAIYRTFVRPQMEYGAPLLKAFVDMRSDPSILKPLQLLHDRALRWVLCASDTSFHPVIHEGILGALPVYDRFTHLRCRFQLHLDQSFAQNPLRKILRNPLTTLGKLVSHLRKDALYDSFKRTREYKDAPIHTKDSDSNLLSEYLLSLRSAHLRNREVGKVLLKYISPRSRTDRLTDKVLYAPPQFQTEFIAWRRGALFGHQKCIKCRENWHRGHIKCLPSVLLPLKLECIWQDEIRDRHPGQNFSRIDFLLNEGEWELAHTALDHWRKALRYISNYKLTDFLDPLNLLLTEHSHDSISHERMFPFQLVLIYRNLDVRKSPPRGGIFFWWAGHLPRLDRKMCWVGRKLVLSVGLLGGLFLYGLFLVGGFPV